MYENDGWSVPYEEEAKVEEEAEEEEGAKGWLFSWELRNQIGAPPIL